jgi:hypothetical protein
MRRKIVYNPARDYYVILGVSPSASTEEIRRAFRQRALEVHPDRHPDRRDWATNQFQLINEAYDVLRQGSLRREYDRVRWPHAPHKPRPAPGSGAHDGAAPYDPNRSWWQQATAQSARQAEYFAASQAAPPIPGWMRGLRLQQYEPTWTTLVGLGRTPYSGLIMVLSMLLALNLAAIVYMAIEPGESHAFINRVEGWFAEEPTAVPPTPGSNGLYRACTNPGAQILNLVSFDKVGETFAVYGTAKHADLWSYVVELGYLGRAYDPQAIPRSWTIVRDTPANQSVPEAPIENDVLADAVSLNGYARGYYVLRLRLILRSGAAQAPCDVIIQH